MWVICPWRFFNKRAAKNKWLFPLASRVLPLCSEEEGVSASVALLLWIRSQGWELWGRDERACAFCSIELIKCGNRFGKKCLRSTSHTDHNHFWGLVRECVQKRLHWYLNVWLTSAPADYISKETWWSCICASRYCQRSSSNYDILC